MKTEVLDLLKNKGQVVQLYFDHILKLPRSTKDYDKAFAGRESMTQVHSYDSYDDERYRCIMFCVGGSPVKWAGSATLVNGKYWELSTTVGRFFLDGKGKFSKKRPQWN